MHTHTHTHTHTHNMLANRYFPPSHGRTETIRPASSLAKVCAELMERTHPASVEEVVEAIRKATAYHFNLTRQAAMGEAGQRQEGSKCCRVGSFTEDFNLVICDRNCQLSDRQ